jgi:hypothetical protein
MAGEFSQLGLDGLEDMLSDTDEIVRIFMGREGPNTLLVDAERIGEPFILGMLCVDLMKHGAMAFAQAQGVDPEEGLQSILSGLMEELQNPTDGGGSVN